MRFFLLNISLLLCVFSLGQESLLQPILVRPFSSNQLPSPVVYSVGQTSSGYIYLGTEEGLVKYNGVYYQTIELSTKGSAVHNIVCKGDTAFCLTFSKELVRVIGNEVNVYGDNEFIIHKASVLRLFEDFLIILDLRSLQVIDVNSMEVVLDYQIPVKSQLFHDVFERHDSIKLVYNYYKSMSLSGFDKIIGKGEKNQRECKLRTFKIDGQSKLIDFTNKSMTTIEESGGISSETSLDYLQSQKLHKVDTYKDSLLFISTYNGLFIADKNGKFLSHILQGVPLSNVFTDSFGQIWISTMNDGVFLLKSLKDKKIDLKYLLSNKDKVHSSFVDSTHLLLGTDQGYLISYNLNSHATKKIKLSSDAEVKFIRKAGNLGFYAFCEELFLLNEDIEPLDSMEFTAMKDVIELDSSIYIGTSFGLSTTTNFKDGHDIKLKHWVRSLSMSLDSSIIFANTDEGVLIYDPELGKVELDTSKLKVKTQHKVGITTFVKGHSLFLERSKNQIVIELKEGFVDYKLSEENILILYKNFIEVISYANTKSIKHLEKGFELLDEPIIDFNLIGDQLFVVYYENVQITNVNSFLVNKSSFIQGIKVNDSNSLVDLKLPYQGDLKITADIPVNIIDRGESKLLYRIKGVTDDWKEMPLNKENYELNLERFPSGNFEIEIKAKNRSGIESPIVSIPIFVASPYWQKWWFLILMLIVICSTGVLIFKLRLAKVKKKNKKELQIKRLEIQSLNAKLEALRSQMNPHFIFNTINTIQAQIISNDSDNAYDSLNTFAKLIRSALEFSTTNYVTIQQDSSFLKSYLQLEALRFNHELDFEVHIDNDLENSNPEIPSLLTQPFVENSIKHGLMHKREGIRKISVLYSIKDNMLQITITDNGIGREKSAQINQANKANKPKSYATEAIDRRVEALNNLERKKVSVETLDLDHGTQVIINVELNK